MYFIAIHLKKEPQKVWYE